MVDIALKLILSQIEVLLISVIIWFSQVPTGFNVLKTKGNRYPKDVIIQSVYLELKFSLSYRDIDGILMNRDKSKRQLDLLLSSGR